MAIVSIDGESPSPGRVVMRLAMLFGDELSDDLLVRESASGVVLV